MKLRLATLAVLPVVAALAAPSSAAAAKLTVNHACYGPGEVVHLVGTGFTPNGQVAVAAGSTLLAPATANGVGVFGKLLRAPDLRSTGLAERRDTVAAVDATNTAIRAAVQVRITRLKVSVSPSTFRPGRKLRIRARGFTRGKSLYAHVRRGKHYKKNVRVGRLKKPCGILSKKRKLLRRGTHSGTYKVQFDSKRRYSRKTRPAARYKIRVFRVIRAAGASSSSSSAVSTRAVWTEER